MPFLFCFVCRPFLCFNKMSPIPITNAVARNISPNISPTIQ